MTVLLLGATGRFGALTPLLINRGHKVLASTRDPGSAAARRLGERGANVVAVDFDDNEQLISAARQADAVVAAGTAHAAGPAADVRHGRNIIDAAAAAGTSHLVYLTVAGADRPSGVPIMDSKHVVEQHLAATTVPYTIIAPAYFMDNVWNPWNTATLAAGQWPSPVSRTRLLQQIPVADLLEFTAYVLEHRESTLGQRIEIASDEITAEDAANTVSTIVGHHLDIYESPQNPLFSWLEREGTHIDIAALRRRYDIDWHNFEGWARTQNWTSLQS